jgi:hypothetical protein
MVIRIILAIALIALAAGFIFFAGNVIWLGTREFFRIYGPSSKKPATPPAAPAPSGSAPASAP